MSQFKIALQTMVLHHDIDAIGIYEALGKAKEIGFNAVEISGHFQCTTQRVADLCRAQKDFGMEVAALNANFNGGLDVPAPPMRDFKPLDLMEDFDTVVSYARQLGTAYVRYAGMPVEQLDTLEKLAAYARVAEEYACRLEAQGLTLCMHEHDDEFARIEGKTYYQWIVELAPHLNFEFCTGGASHAAADLTDTLELVKGRAPLIHFTDIMIEPPTPGCGRRSLQDKVKGCIPGDGNINVKKFCDAADACGNRYFILETNDFHGEDPYHAMSRAVAYLKKLGFADRF